MHSLLTQRHIADHFGINQSNFSLWVRTRLGVPEPFAEIKHESGTSMWLWLESQLPEFAEWLSFQPHPKSKKFIQTIKEHL